MTRITRRGFATLGAATMRTIVDRATPYAG